MEESVKFGNKYIETMAMACIGAFEKYFSAKQGLKKY